ncbi:MAG: HlyD family type I secretion periplasmic adaptor subunit, partial [Burkholderiales bacterium]
MGAADKIRRLITAPSRWFGQHDANARLSNEFQPDAVELEQKPPPRLAHATLYALLAFVIIGVLWASFSKVDMIVIAQGRLVSTAQTFVVQSLETAVVRSIDVRVGQVVKKGETVATLDPTFAIADVSQVRQRIVSLDAEIRRLEAEMNEKPFSARTRDEDELLQASMYEKRVSEYQSRIKGYQADLAKLDADMKGTLRSKEVLKQRLASVKEAEAMREELYKQKFVSNAALLESRDKRLEVETSFEDATNKANQLVQQLQQTRYTYEAFTKTWRQKILEDLLKARRDRDSLLEQQTKADRKSALVSLTSPMDATVLEINKRSVGTVAKEAEPIMTLVPYGVPLEADIQIPADEIGFVRKGDPVRIKIDAFPFQKHGTLDGKLS